MTLPEGWVRAELSDLVGRDGFIVDGDWVESRDQDPNGEVRLTQLADVGDGCFRDRSARFLTRSKAVELRCTYLAPGDVLIARMPDPLGRACVFPQMQRPCVSVVDVCIVRTGVNGVDPRWLMFAMNAPATRRSIEAQQQGTTRKRIAKSRLLELALPLPPLTEQRRIVESLETHFTRLDAAVATLERVRAKLKRYRAAVLQAAFEGRLGAAVGTKKWEQVTLGDIAEVKGGLTKGKRRGRGECICIVPYLRVANVQRGHLDLSEMKVIEATEAEIGQLRLRDGDVLFNEGGDRDKLGRGWVWRDQIAECIHQNHVFRARLMRSGTDPRFISWYGNSVAQGYFLREGKQTTNLASINLRVLKSLPIPLPSPAEQRRVVDEIDSVLSICDAAETIVDAVRRRAERLRESLLRDAFGGRLVPQDPRDEPASVLLDRIRRERAAETSAPKKRPARSRR